MRGRAEIHYRPVAAMEHFLRLGKFASVALDPFPFGGGVTSLEILSTGTPIITLPNATSVLQLTLGFYRAMQKDDTGAGRLLDKHCVAHTIPEYIKKAVRYTVYINPRMC